MTRLLRHFPTEDDIKAIFSQYIEMEPVSVEALAKVITFVRIVNKGLDLSLEQFGLSDGRFSVLVLLASENRGGTMTPSALAKAVDVSKPTMTGLITRLEQKKLIVCRKNPNDLRGFTVAITSQGRRCVDNVMPLHLQRLQKFICQVDARETRALIPILEKLLQGVHVFETPAKLKTRAASKARAKVATKRKVK